MSWTFISSTSDTLNENVLHLLHLSLSCIICHYCSLNYFLNDASNKSDLEREPPQSLYLPFQSIFGQDKSSSVGIFLKINESITFRNVSFFCSKTSIIRELLIAQKNCYQSGRFRNVFRLRSKSHLSDELR